MALRSKNLVIIVTILIGLLGIIYMISHLVLLRSFADLENRDTRDNVKRALNGLSGEISALYGKAGDWSNWDDTYTFIKDSSQGYIKSNLTDNTFVELRLNFILFLRSSGRIVLSKGFDLGQQKALPLPESLKAHLSGDLLRRPPASGKRVMGIVLLPEGPLLIASRPILTSDGNGPSRGTLIFARYLDDVKVESLAKEIKLSLSVCRVDDPRVPSDLREAGRFLSVKSPVFIRPLDVETIGGYALIDDIYGKPALTMRIILPRAIYRQGQESIRYFIFWFLAIGLGFSAAAKILTDRLIRARHERYESEKAYLATVQQSEERYRAVVEQSSEGIILVDAETNRILQINAAFESLLGYSGEELLEACFDELISYDQESIDRNYRSIQDYKTKDKAQEHFISEQRYRRKDGSLVDVEVTNTLILHNEGRMLCVVARDVTERKRAEEEIRSLNVYLERSNLELAMAYEATIEGWAHALELRDQETEGHSRRVTDMSVRLARAIGMSEEELTHVRRGALLHDIGKMGIPDGILLKPGPLTDEERAIMCRHTEYAYKMLSPIDYLRPAIDIPYCHHEKWDGTGYPRGLKGEQIPLAARIFAVADVWDALSSDRPYRTAWPPKKVGAYIQSQSGTHFDPGIVEVFLHIMSCDSAAEDIPLLAKSA